MINLLITLFVFYLLVTTVVFIDGFLIGKNVKSGEDVLVILIWPLGLIVLFYDWLKDKLT